MNAGARPGAVHALDVGLAHVAETARRSLVRIEVARGGRRHPRLREQGVGSGTVWSADGLVITNAHVVAGALGRRGARRGRGRRRRGTSSWRSRPARSASRGGAEGSPRLRMRLPDGRTSEATVLAVDPKADLAALQVDVGSEPLRPVAIGDARVLRTGALVVAVGHPWGVDGAATAGAVIGLDEGFGDLRSPGREWLAVGAKLRPGHSGGPMLDARGRLVGINTIMNGHGVGVAIPVHAVADFLARGVVDVRVA